MWRFTKNLTPIFNYFLSYEKHADLKKKKKSSISRKSYFESKNIPFSEAPEKVKL